MSKQVFFVSGMTCSSCAATISEALEALACVQTVSVNHHSGKVDILAAQSISRTEVEAALPKKYALLDASMGPTNKLTQLKPLFLIVTFLIGADLMIHWASWELNAMMYDFMGMFFLVFSFFKLLDVKGFQMSFRQYDPLAARVGLYGWIYPFIELGLGVCYVLDYVPHWILWTTIFVLVLTTVGVVRVLLQKQQMQCACLGSVLNLPMTEATFIENAIMLVMAGSLLL
jgi:copper chaperone CopZ